MEKKYIYILIIAVAVYFIFFKKSKESETEQKRTGENKPKFATGLKNLSLKGLDKPFQEVSSETMEGLARTGIFTTVKQLTFNLIPGNLSTKTIIPINTNLYGTLVQELEDSTKGILKSSYKGKNFVTTVNISDLK
jgi:hypothetical protein